MLSFLVKAAIFAGLILVARQNLNIIDAYGSSIVAPRSNEEAILDLQFAGFTCAQASTLLSSFTPVQREGLRKVYTDLYDVYWPLSLMAVNLFLVYWAKGRLSRWLAFPLVLFGLDMIENVLNLDMIRAVESQVAAGKAIDLTPNCIIVGSFITPLKWALVPVFFLVVAYLLISKIFCGHKAQPQAAKRKTN